MSDPKEMTPERLDEVREGVARWVHESYCVESYPGSALSVAERAARDLLAHVDTLAARAEAAERAEAGARHALEDERNRAGAAEKKLAALAEADVATGDVYARPESTNLVDSNTILVVTSTSDVDSGGTCRAQPYMRMPFDSWYPRSMLGRRIARGEP